MRTGRLLVVGLIALGGACTAHEANGGEQPALWKIQKLLASKKYVDLTHEFAPGIPRWPGFPDETRKTIYWYDKRPDTVGSGFFSEIVHARGAMGDACRSSGAFHQGTAHGRSD